MGKGMLGLACTGIHAVFEEQPCHEEHGSQANFLVHHLQRGGIPGALWAGQAVTKILH